MQSLRSAEQFQEEGFNIPLEKIVLAGQATSSLLPSWEVGTVARENAGTGIPSCEQGQKQVCGREPSPAGNCLWSGVAGTQGDGRVQQEMRQKNGHSGPQTGAGTGVL